MFGDWPSLANETLDDGADLAITTDYRHVLGEVMAKHMGTPDISSIFPAFDVQARGAFL